MKTILVTKEMREALNNGKTVIDIDNNCNLFPVSEEGEAVYNMARKIKNFCESRKDCSYCPFWRHAVSDDDTICRICSASSPCVWDV